MVYYAYVNLFAVVEVCVGWLCMHMCLCAGRARDAGGVKTGGETDGQTKSQSILSAGSHSEDIHTEM